MEKEKNENKAEVTKRKKSERTTLFSAQSQRKSEVIAIKKVGNYEITKDEDVKKFRTWKNLTLHIKRLYGKEKQLTGAADSEGIRPEADTGNG